MIHTRPSTPDDATAIELGADNLAEFRRLSSDPIGVMRQVIAASAPDAVTFLDHTGHTLAIAGAYLDEKNRRVYPWCISSPLVEKHAKALLLISRTFVAALRERDNSWEVCGHIGKSSTRNRAFIQRLGFRIDSTHSGAFDFFYLPFHV